jgi:Uma2 family endonuclease
MSTAVLSAAPIETLADLLDRLGNVPLERIRFRPYPGTATEADVLTAMQGPRERLCELVEGVLVEKAMGYRESGLAGFLLGLLNAFVRPRNLGIVTGADGTVRLMAGLLRIPDVAFTSWERIPGRRWPTAPIPALAPDLAVEVLSTSNTAAEMARKRLDYFTAGVWLVWEIDPDARVVSVYTGVDSVRALRAGDILDGGAVPPGFTLPLHDLFAELDRQG